mmetsp:Transcript_6697/g.16028  ORF Transcript_6697/g.16028 Transcript_6697/m.16028 type:complete len:578 (-) Transcript_6697:1464-3197(-)|eukprot:CAMPEP_0201206514 /NCGR_PEP_ID=MMETSP0851-20130426/172860_1 /ASSEMBLY_ACC=CAM_ASM_000631 /TAXON_ID=183588 /ORGANISM="Pseudo-nitzschia fraudulenta, Strain WWA7" /LENGTH=577 /DNA_ID=CAMNT_0047494869 /DNA_START=101 /DNA_END=1834 /DNA_ORIENTATION=+
MEPGGPSSFTQQREKLTRLAALAEAVSEQKFPPSSTMRNNNVPMNYELQHYNNAPLQADPMRTESRGFTELNGGHIPATHASPNDINPLSIHELPSNFLHTEQHLLDPVSSLSRKRQRVGYPLNSEEQQMSRKLGPEKERSMQNHQQHHDQNQQSFPPRSNSWPPQPQPQQKPKLQPKKSVDGVRFREYQAEIWSEKFEELCTFRRFHKHCHVPHHYSQNLGLAQWVKRQRYQYKLKIDGKRSTLSEERIRLLNKIGFIWNSHDVVWEERLQDLLEYKRVHGDCIVPSNFEGNPQLAVWTKRQRRQYKKHQDGSSSSMTPDRIAKLEQIGFVWDCRKSSSNNTNTNHNNNHNNIKKDADATVSASTGVKGSTLASVAIPAPGNDTPWPKTQRAIDDVNNLHDQNHSASNSIDKNTNISSILRGNDNASSDIMNNWPRSVLTLPLGGGNNHQALLRYNNMQASSHSTRAMIFTGTSSAASESNSSRTGVGSSPSRGNTMGRKASADPVANDSSASDGIKCNNSREPQLPSLGEMASEGTTELPRMTAQNKENPRATLRCDFYSFSRNYCSPNNSMKPS